MTSLRRLLAWLSPDQRRADRARSDLRSNAEKALRMKQEAQAEELASRPHSDTPNEGMQPVGETRYGDATRASQGSFTPGLKRAHVPRSGDGA